MNENNISLKSIYDLMELHFIIPSYQRGYRWTKLEVTDLLQDIWEFNQKRTEKEEFYCLQPVVVIPSPKGYILLDGQQRLTTIFIILKVFKDLKKFICKKKDYSLEYETRKDSETFLQKINLEEKTKNIDYYHICNAYETVKKWFDDHEETVSPLPFLQTLLERNDVGSNVRVIWYEVNNSDVNPIDVFTRINMGKIQLTNAELIKALFLRKSTEADDTDLYKIRKAEIANEWDIIENKLGNDEFWYFLTNKNDIHQKYENRIEFIFSMMPDTPTNGKYGTFRYFNNRIKNATDKKSIIDNLWKEVKQHFQTFLEWFENKKHFHYIGFLITTGVPIQDMIKDAQKNATKTEFEKHLVKLISEQVKSKDIYELSYADNKEKKIIKRILLLHNVITLNNNEFSNSRFQFDRYKKEKNWDIEHIRSIKSDIPDNSKKRTAWLKDVLKVNPSKEIINGIDDYFSCKKEEEESKFKIIYEKVLGAYEEEEEIHDISNLALLDAGTNRGYKNAIFPVKRREIILKEKKGKFIPIATKNVFLKSYNMSIENVTSWNEDDRTAYLNDIKTTLQPFLTAINNNNDN